MSTIGTRIFTWFRGRLVGTDEYGNRYYETRRSAHKRRWVLYHGIADASKVPPQWHGWLHHTHAASLNESAPHYAWSKPHLPNLTGTRLRYLPPGHLERGARRAPASADYEPWRPE